MITKKRYGVKEDGNVVEETTTYVPTTEDHPLAVQLPGEEGFWVRTMVGNALVRMGAREVSRSEFVDAAEEIQLRTEAMLEELEARREIRQREMEEKKAGVSAELKALGLSPDTISAIINQVRE